MIFLSIFLSLSLFSLSQSHSHLILFVMKKLAEVGLKGNGFEGTILVENGSMKIRLGQKFLLLLQFR